MPEEESQGNHFDSKLYATYALGCRGYLLSPVT